MLTLFHHSLPPWAAEYGGWKLEKTVDYFLDFTRFAFVRHKPFYIGLYLSIASWNFPSYLFLHKINVILVYSRVYFLYLQGRSRFCVGSG